MDVGPSTVRYPDVVADVAGGAFRDLAATAPAIIAEVVSPSSEIASLGAALPLEEICAGFRPDSREGRAD